MVEEPLTVGDWNMAEHFSEWIEIAAVFVITAAVMAAFVVGARAVRADGVGGAVERIKQVVGRGLLLGLDLLIAADVIRTVTLDPTLENVAALGVLVVVRTFLAWSLTVELHGCWPWQRSVGTARPGPPYGSARRSPLGGDDERWPHLHARWNPKQAAPVERHRGHDKQKEDVDE